MICAVRSAATTCVPTMHSPRRPCARRAGILRRTLRLRRHRRLRRGEHRSGPGRGFVVRGSLAYAGSMLATPDSGGWRSRVCAPGPCLPPRRPKETERSTALVLVDPIPSGRSFVSEQRAMAAMALGVSANREDGSVETPGVVYDAADRRGSEEVADRNRRRATRKKRARPHAAWNERRRAAFWPASDRTRSNGVRRPARRT